jgi:hypothetical protein
MHSLEYFAQISQSGSLSQHDATLVTIQLQGELCNCQSCVLSSKSFGV